MVVGLPNEAWGLVLGKLEGLHDFARSQLVSRTFYTLVLKNSWTKVRKIGFVICKRQRELVKVKIDTGVPMQTLFLGVDEAAPLLEKLIQKATKTMALDLNLIRVTEEDQEEVLRRFLEAVATFLTKVTELSIASMAPLESWRASQTMTRFLHNNAQSLTNLMIDESRSEGGFVPPQQLLQAFQSCSSLQQLDIFAVESALVARLLHHQPNLKSVFLSSDVPATSLVGCGAKLERVRCPLSDLTEFLDEVQRQNRSLDHPLLTLKALLIFNDDEMPALLPWALLPNLGLFTVEYHSIGNLTSLVQSYLMHWSAVPKSLEFRMESLERDAGGLANSEDVARIGTAVARACHCPATVTHNIGVHRTQHTLEFRKGDATVKVLIGHN